MRRPGTALVALLAVSFLGLATPAAAQSIDLTWNASPEPNLAGYRVYVGTTSGSYSQSYDVPPTSTTFAFLNPAPLTRYYFAVTAFNTNGLESSYSNEVSAVLGGDSLPPTLTILSPAAPTTVTTSSIAVNGTAADNVGVTRVTWSNDRGGSGVAAGTTTWSMTVALQPGANVITVTAEDGENTTSRSVTVTYNAPDTTLPNITITNPSSNVTVTTSSISVSGTASDNVGVTQVTWSNSAGGSGTASGTTSWSATVSLTPGANVITVTARDAAGNTRSASRTVTYNVPDTTLPTIAITAPATGTMVALANVTVSGTASDNVGVTQVTWSNDRGGSGTASGTTSWSASVPLQSGTNVVTVTARDAANNTRQASVTLTRVVPTVATEPMAVSPSGSISTNTPTFVWTSVQGVSAYQLWVNDAAGNGRVQSTHASSQVCNASTGLCTASPGVTITGTAQWWVRKSDGGDWGAALSFTVPASGPDTVAPTVTITTPVSGATVNSPTVALLGTASDNVGVTQVTWTNDRGGNGTATGTTSWSVSAVTLQLGANLLTVTARDAAGNTRQASVTVNYSPPDSTPPSVAIMSPSGATTVGTPSIAISGTASDNVAVTQVSWSNSRGSSGTATGTTSWAVVDVPLQAGANVITVTARDAANNTAQASVTVTYASGPTSNVPVPVSPSGTAPSNTPTFVWTPAAGAPNYQLWVNDSSGNGRIQTVYSAAQAGCSVGLGNCSAAPGIALTGTVVWWVRNVTAGGDWGASLTFSVPGGGADTTPPNVAISSPTSGQTVSTSTVAVSGTASDNVAVSSVTWSNDRGGSGTANGTTSWSIPSVGLQPGANVITVTAADAAGNTRQSSVNVTCSVPGDTTPPTVTIASPANGSTTTAAAITLTGSASDSVGVTQVTWTNSRGGSGTASGTSSWTAANVPLQSGTNVITVTARDAANNAGTASVTVTSNQPAASPVPVPLSPSGTSSSATPSFQWSPGRDVSSYQLWVNDGLGNGRIQSVYTAAQANCSGGVGTCSASPGVTLSGTVQWWVRNAAGGDWGASLTFTVPTSGDTTPPTVAITSPANNTTASGSAVALSGTASDNVGVTQVTWVNDRGGSGTASGTTSWSVASVPLQSGTNVITVTARDAAGNGRQASVSVTYTPPPVNTLPVPVSPVGTAATRTPTFVWTAVPGATGYQIWANDAAGNGRIQHNYTPAEAGCGSGTGTCSATPNVVLSGTVQWWVRTSTGDWSTPLTFTVP